MKKALILMLALIIAIVPLSGCKENPNEYEIISVWEDGEPNQSDSQNANANQSEDDKGTDKGTGKETGKDTSKDTTSVSKDISDLKGKTYTLAVHSTSPIFYTTSFDSMISAFESKYGCKIKKVGLEFDKYNQMVSQRLSTGDPYDIVYIHGSFVPQGSISGLYEDLTPAIKALKPKSHINDASEWFDWKGKSYGLVNSKNLYPYVMFYNKVMFEESGFEDPLTLYKQGKWTWDKIFEMGKEAVADGGTYFFGHTNTAINMFGEIPVYINSDGKVVNNIGSKKVRKAYETIQKIYAGSNAIGMPPEDVGDGWADYFPKGKCYMIVEESQKYADLAPNVKKSMAFNKDIDNLGIVPFPMDSNNTSKAYPTGWYTAVGAGKGADPRVAVLWAEFEANYNSPVQGANDIKGEQKKLVESLLKQKTVPVRHGLYSTNATNTNKIFPDMLWDVRKGVEISKVISDNSPQIDACIEATVGKGNYISK